jgi:hypothetical protein
MWIFLLLSVASAQSLEQVYNLRHGCSEADCTGTTTCMGRCISYLQGEPCDVSTSDIELYMDMYYLKKINARTTCWESFVTYYIDVLGESEGMTTEEYDRRSQDSLHRVDIVDGKWYGFGRAMNLSYTMNIMTMNQSFTAPDFCPFLDVKIHVFPVKCKNLVNSENNHCTKTEIIKHHADLCVHGFVAEDDIIFNQSPDACDHLLSILRWSGVSSYDYINLGAFIFDINTSKQTTDLILGDSMHTHSVIYSKDFCTYLKTSVPAGSDLDWRLMKHSKRAYVSKVPLFVQSPFLTAKGNQHFTEELQSYYKHLNINYTSLFVVDTAKPEPYLPPSSFTNGQAVRVLTM